MSNLPSLVGLLVATTVLAVPATSPAVPAASSARAVEPAPTVERAPTEGDARPPTPATRKQPSEAVRLGVYGAAGFPALLTVGGGLIFARSVHVGFEYGSLPVSSIGSIDVGYRSYAADLRIFPIAAGPFFFGTRVGRQHVSAAFAQTVGDYGTANGSLTGDGWYVNPRVGLLWTTSWGLSAGIDAGLRVPLSHTTSESVSAGVSVPSSATSAVHLFVGRTIPSVTLLQLGLVF